MEKGLSTQAKAGKQAHPLRSLLISLGVIVVVLGAVVLAGWLAIQSLLAGGVLQMSDITGALDNAKPQFIPVGILIAVIVVALIVFWKAGRKFNFWLKWESFLAVLVALVLALAVTLLGPMSNLMSLNMAKLGTITAATKSNSLQVASDITDEGTVLLKNVDNFLPMSDTTNLNVFGWASSNPLYTGSGSGSADTSKAVSIYKGLQQAGFKTNDSLLNFYTKYRADRPSISMFGQDWTLPEPAVSQYSDDLISQAKSFSDTALVVLARNAGEGADIPTDMSKLSNNCKAKPSGSLFAIAATYCGNKGDFTSGQNDLQISNSEKNLLDLVNKDFKNVVVLINSGNTMEAGFLNDYSHIKAALWMAGPGDAGFTALGKILRGTVNPSGRTVDTWAYDDKSSPTYNNFGAFSFTNDKMQPYVDYNEGIYVGYKFYETYFLGNQAGYQKTVQFPFGYGLSYTNFSEKMSPLTKQSDDKYSFTVDVTNTGKVAGKDVAEIYYTAPYTNGGIEKAATNLLTYQKTRDLAPGESQTLNFTVDRQDMASYDSSAANRTGAYVLDKGNYQVQLKSDSHTVVASQSFDVPSKIVYSGSNKRASDKVAAQNQFASAQGTDVTYLSRKDKFANYAKATAAPQRTISDAQKATISSPTNTAIPAAGDTKMPTTGANNGLKLADLKGKSYSDPQWSKLLDQLSVSDMSNLIANAGYQTPGINSSIGLAHTYTFDGPSGFNSSFVSNLNATAYPVAPMIAATWNANLAKAKGQSIGQQGDDLGVYGWYGPAMDLHRSPFGGRDFEYYSEDGVLSGDTAASEIAGAKQYGVFAFVKHFAMNEQETNRMVGLSEWDTEQSMREVYLKPYEISVKQAGPTAVMNAFNFIGTTWCGANSALLNNVLRDEWGFRGLAETDYFVAGTFMNADQAVLGGTDLMLSTNGAKLDTSNAKVVQAMRTAVHNVAYTVVNSHAYSKDGQVDLTLPWQAQVYTIIGLALGVIVLLQAFVVFLFVRKFGKKALARKAAKATAKAGKE